MQHQTQRFDARVFAPGFHTGSRNQTQRHALAGETFYGRADITPRARNWVRALRASAIALASPARG